MTQSVEGLLRELAPQVLGVLVRRYGQFDAAEDAVQEALLAASTQWPREGVPENPRSWLVSVAGRRLVDEFRSDSARRRREVTTAFTETYPEISDRDDTLMLLFLCAHPALSPPSQLALTLRAVGGLTTGEIAAAFLVPGSTMAQRISRAKQTIRKSGQGFDGQHERDARRPASTAPPQDRQPSSASEPGRQPSSVSYPGCQPSSVSHPGRQPSSASESGRQPSSVSHPGRQPSSASEPGRQPSSASYPGPRQPPEERAERLRVVRQVLYLIFNEGYTASGGPDLQRADLTTEAIRLTRMLRELVPGDHETTGLLALMLLTDARRPGRTAANGDLVPLDRQDRTLWSKEMIAEGVALISSALGRGPVGPYQIQAAIAALHDEAADDAQTDWPQILALYDVLERLSPGPVVTLNRAVAVARTQGPLAGLAVLGDLDGDDRMAGHHRVEAVRAHLLEQAGFREEARAAFRTAARLTTSVPERKYLLAKASLTTPEQKNEHYGSRA
ncbi:sigma-70 family RNA polymerase sigma factor [Actinoplanes sp. TBRC 11911]|uniref:RNA polymerase sigma factor n=1 Tax=Actinoplanes sp. TBRC 11911 TaxID=2729386 RepID=UPI00145F93D5|nr:sigma-70 family RNA polymerase sigma factor [Actinoplanes sp. TBRC 11911]NMO51251.1 sigma-70 family RNA polymerase sigma factor [Actinoplanes sp. TBRC 11911]